MPRRHDVLAHWLTHGQITPRQAEAGRRFRDLYEVAEIEGHAFIDISGPRAPLTAVGRSAAEARAEARSELQDLRQILGAIDFALVCRVVGAGGDLVGSTVVDGKRAVVDTRAAKEAEKRYLAHRIRDALAVLASRFAIGSIEPINRNLDRGRGPIDKRGVDRHGHPL